MLILQKTRKLFDDFWGLERGRIVDWISIISHGSYIRKGQELINGNKSDLLYQQNGVEAVLDYMPKGTVGIYSPSAEGSTELYYIISGKIAVYDLDETIILQTGDLYVLEQLDKYVIFEVLEDSKELYLCNSPCYDHNEEKIATLMKVLLQLQETDGDTMSHCERVKALSMGIAHQLRYDQTQLRLLFYAARFHDVGKSQIPPEILLKPSRLTQEEYEVMKQHSQYTYEMIRDCFGLEIATIAYEHHEHLNGTGYPRGLSGEAISLPARIICVADAYDAMVTTRPYHIGKSREAALSELHRCLGTQFDPIVVEALEKHLATRPEE